MRARVVGAVLVFLSLCAPAARAQTTETGVIQGRVLAEDGSPIASATIEVAQPDGSYPKSTITGADGSYRIPFLPPGIYDLTARMIGYRQTDITGIRVRASLATPVAVALAPAPVEMEGITVEAERPLIDVETTEYKGVLDEQQIDILPTSRTATDLIDFTAGARPGQVWGGSTSQANAYQIDGVSVNAPGFGGDFLLPSVDWIKEVTVLGLGAGAEYGNFQGGQFNLVTKSGTNTLTGSLRANTENASLNGSNLNGVLGGDEVDARYEFFGDVGGPLIRDKLYYYASANYITQDTRVVDIYGTLEDPSETTCNPADPFDCDFVYLPQMEERKQLKGLAKLTWQATEKDKFNVQAGLDNVFTDNRGLNSFDEPITSTKQESPAFFYGASWQRVLNANNLFELKLTGFDGRDDRVPYGGPDLPSVQLLSGDDNIFNNAKYVRDREPSSIAFAATWDSYLRTGAVEHHLKIGGNLDLGSWFESRIRTGGLTWRPDEDDDAFDPGDGNPFDPDDPGTWDFISSDWAGTIRLDANTTNGAVFVQDYISLSDRLNLNPGVRVGYWKGTLNPLEGASFTAVDDVAFAPRLGVTYDLSGDGGLVLKGHYGWYYQSLFALMFDRAENSAGEPGALLEREQYWDWVGDELPDITRRYAFPTDDDPNWEFFDDGSGFTTAPVENYKQPYLEQWILGVEKALTDNLKVELVYVNRRNRDILALVDRNLSTNYTKYENVAVIDWRADEPVLDQDGSPLVLEELYVSNDDILYLGEAPGLTPEQVAGLDYDPDIALTEAEDAERKMDQFQLILSGNLASWFLSGSVVYTDLRGNFFTVNGYESSDGTGDGAFVEPNGQINFSGQLPNYADWEFKAQASGPLSDLGLGGFLGNFRTGAFLRLQSGDHYTPTYTIDRRNHDFYLCAGAPSGSGCELGDYLDPDLLFGVSGQTINLEERGSRKYDMQALLDLHLEYGIPLRRTRLVLEFDWFNVFNDGAVTSVRTSVNNQDPAQPTTLYGAPRFRVPPSTLRLGASFRF